MRKVNVRARKHRGASSTSLLEGIELALQAGAVSGSAVIPGAAYTLADATTGLPFVVTHPTAPTIATEANVTPATIGQDNNLTTNGRRLILGAGNYGSLTIGGTDKEIVLTTGVVFDTLTLNSASRFVIRASPARTGFIGKIIANTCSDLLYDSVFVDAEAYDINDTPETIHACNRVAILSSRFRAHRFTVVGYHSTSHLIIANSQIIGISNQCIRLHSLQNFALVDSRIYEEAGSASLRLHATNGEQQARNLYVGRNQFEGGPWQFQPVGDGSTTNNTAGMTEAWIVNNNVYGGGSWYIKTNALPQVPVGDRCFVEIIRITDNNLYSTGGVWPGVGDNDWTATISNPPVQSTATAPAWSYQ